MKFKIMYNDAFRMHENEMREIRESCPNAFETGHEEYIAIEEEINTMLKKEESLMSHSSSLIDMKKVKKYHMCVKHALLNAKFYEINIDVEQSNRVGYIELGLDFLIISNEDRDKKYSWAKLFYYADNIIINSKENMTKMTFMFDLRKYN